MLIITSIQLKIGDKIVVSIIRDNKKVVMTYLLQIIKKMQNDDATTKVIDVQKEKHNLDNMQLAFNNVSKNIELEDKRAMMQHGGKNRPGAGAIIKNVQQQS